MTQQVGLGFLILQLVLGASGQEPRAQGVSNHETLTGVRVLEKAATATLKKNIIRVMLPLSAAAGPDVKVAAWIVAPDDTRSGERIVTIEPGERAAALTLDWPNDSRNVPVGDVSWYRILYRVETSGAETAHGILSVGAIAANLMRLSVVYPQRIVSHEAISVRVIAANPVTGKPLAGARVTAKLANEDADVKAEPETCLATTGANGEAILTFAAMGDPGDTLDLTLDGTLSGEAGALASDHLEATLDLAERTKVLVETDKPLHKPGETVHLRALVILDAGRIAPNEDVTLTIDDPDNKKLVKEGLKTNAYGIAAYDWKTSEQTATGDYDVTFDVDKLTDDGSTGKRTVRIQRYDLPEFHIVATTDQPYYLIGERPSVKIDTEYLFGKPVASGKVRVVRADNAHWDPKTGRMEEPDTNEAKAELDANGDATVILDVKKDAEDLSKSRYEKYRDMGYRALVTDATTGKTEPLRFTVRLTQEAVHVFLNRLGGDGHEGEFMIRTSYADGKSAACTVALDWMNAEQQPSRAASVTTNRFGLAKVLLHYPARANEDYRNLRITANDGKGKSGHLDDEERISPEEEDPVWISLTHSLLRRGKPIEGTIHGRAGTTADLDVVSENSVLARLSMRLAGDETKFSIPAGPEFRGFVTLDVFSTHEGVPRHHYRGWEPGSARTVFYPENRGLQAQVTGLDTIYPPGGAVNARLNLKTAHGPAAGVFSVSVYDTAVELRAQSEQEDNDGWYGGSFFSPLDVEDLGEVRKSLDATNVSHGIAADLDLAAEAALEGVEGTRIEMETSNDNGARAAYEKTIAVKAKPLGDAIRDAAPDQLPGTLDELKRFANAAKLGDEILLDPWGTPYRVESRTVWNDETVDLVSAGPDKQFGTADDIAASLITHGVFDVPGRRLDRLLKKAQEAGEPLPGTVEDLKKLARDGGLDLDEEAKRGLKLRRYESEKPKPLSYKINLRREFYSVMVEAGDGGMVWRSDGIDFFKREAERLDAALIAWMDAGHAFPEKEGDARLAFKAAGIDFDALSDPLGRPFAIQALRELSYIRVGKAKAGGTISASTDNVTVTAQVIKVLSTEDAGTAPAQNEVARFCRAISQQSGSDLKPVPVESGVFKGHTGAIAGVVTDQTGAIVAGAKVMAKNPATDETWEAETKDDGTYLIYELKPGLYDLRVIARGFQTWILTEIHVSSASLTKVDAMLTVGAATATVTVAADALAVSTDSNTVSTLISSAEVSDIATQNRSFAALAALGLGVSSGGRKSVARGAAGSATITEPAITPRLRHVFEETGYWTPSLETDTTGHAALKFKLPDSLTTWTLHAIGSTIDGRVTAIDHTFITFQPFFVDLDPPQVLTVGDEISLPVNLRNYTPHAITAPVTVKTADWFALTTPPALLTTVPPGGSSALIVGLDAIARTDAGPLQVTAANAHEGDAEEKKVKVHPDGEPKLVTASELVGGGKSAIRFNLPPEIVPGSLHAELLLYPNLGANVYHAMKAVLERPYGCGEQTISSTYPSLLFLELAAATKVESPSRDRAQTYLQLGYERLMGYFNAAGGLTYWGRESESADVALTAYGIEFLSEAEPYVDVDGSRIVRAIEWLLAQQNADGSWKPHYGAPSSKQVLFIAAALEAAMDAKDFGAIAKGDLAARMRQSIAKAQAYAATSAMALHDPYANALRLMLAAKSHDGALVTRLRGELAGEAERGGDGVDWDFDGYSPFYGWGAGGRLEATAMALSALNAAGNLEDAQLESDALRYLLKNRDGYGVWLSGQATVRVLKALLPVAVKQFESPSPSDYNLTVNGQPLSGAQAQALKTDSRLLDAPRTLDLTAAIHAGANMLELAGAGDAAIANAQITAWYYVPWTADARHASTTVAGKGFGFDFGYTCDAENAKAGQPIPCTVSARRFGSQSYGMMLAEAGLPPGADVDRAALGKLLDTRTIERYEIQPDRIVFYLWPSGAEGTKFTFSFIPRYAIRAKAAPAKLTDYYNPDLSAVLSPQTFVVSAGATK